MKFLFDEKNLYVGAWCKDSVGIKGIRVQDLRRDFQWGDDFFGVSLDPQTPNKLLNSMLKLSRRLHMAINEICKTSMI